MVMVSEVSVNRARNNSSRGFLTEIAVGAESDFGDTHIMKGGGRDGVNPMILVNPHAHRTVIQGYQANFKFHSFKSEHKPWLFCLC